MTTSTSGHGWLPTRLHQVSSRLWIEKLDGSEEATDWVSTTTAKFGPGREKGSRSRVNLPSTTAGGGGTTSAPASGAATQRSAAAGTRRPESIQCQCSRHPPTEQ